MRTVRHSFYSSCHGEPDCRLQYPGRMMSRLAWILACDLSHFSLAILLDGSDVQKIIAASWSEIEINENSLIGQSNACRTQELGGCIDSWRFDVVRKAEKTEEKTKPEQRQRAVLGATARLAFAAGLRSYANSHYRPELVALKLTMLSGTCRNMQ